MLEVEHLAVNYQDVSFCIESGQVVGVISPNGAGKSTVFKAMLGFAPSSKGKLARRTKALLHKFKT